MHNRSTIVKPITNDWPLAIIDEQRIIVTTQPPLIHKTPVANITERAYVQLKSDLIACRLPPGKRITISQVQREFGLSQASVREALSRLTAEGLVETERNAGFRATPIISKGFRELAEASIVIEIPCLRSAIEHGDLNWEGQLMANLHVSTKLLKQTQRDNDVDLDNYTANRAEFYDVLLAPCQNQWLLSAWKQLYIKQMRYRHTFRKLAAFEASLGDHYHHFIHAVCARDSNRAIELCLQQYDTVVRFVETLTHDSNTPANSD